MPLRLAYPGITNAFALLRLLPGSDRSKDAEILALRHQLAVMPASSAGSTSDSSQLIGRGWPRCSAGSPASVARPAAAGAVRSGTLRRGRRADW
ncbi:hypothetical protein [Dactylosporangium cerinum]